MRQWVLSFPIPLRLRFATHPELLAPVLRIVHRVIPDRHRAAGSCAAHQRKKLESQGQGLALLGAPRTQHCAATSPAPAIANERLALNRAGQVVLTLKTPYREGTTHIVMSPLEFIQRLAALVPRPRLHLIRFHGVLAPEATQGGACLARRGRSTRLRPDIIPNVPVNANTPSADHAEVPPPAAPAPMSWARLLKRVFEIDIEHCRWYGTKPCRCRRRLGTIFGGVEVRRCGYSAPEERSLFPLDGELNLPKDSYSHGLRERLAVGGGARLV